jgi:hypothetical protein
MGRSAHTCGGTVPASGRPVGRTSRIRARSPTRRGQLAYMDSQRATASSLVDNHIGVGRFPVRFRARASTRSKSMTPGSPAAACANTSAPSHVHRVFPSSHARADRPARVRCRAVEVREPARPTKRRFLAADRIARIASASRFTTSASTGWGHVRIEVPGTIRARRRGICWEHFDGAARQLHL